MDTISGDRFISDCAQYIRYNEAKLANTNSSASSTFGGLNALNPAAWLFAGAVLESRQKAKQGPTSHLRGASTGGATSAIVPSFLPITSHHLFYLLIRCEAIALPVGQLDIPILETLRPPASFTFVPSASFGSHNAKRRDLEETMSINSLQSTMLTLGFRGGPTRNGAHDGRSWWSSEKPVDVNADLKFVFSALTRITAVRLMPPPLKLIDGFEDCPGEMSTPLDILKSVQILEIHDNDPRSYIGWDRLSTQLRSLTLRRTGIEDVQDIVVDAVARDLQRRGDQRGKVEGSSVEQISTTDTCASASLGTDGEEHAGNSTALLPALSWYFLRHLSLADNSLTFLHPTPMSFLARLTSLDLSGNLLNAVPPCLDALEGLKSLNISNNLIDSVLGIPLCIPHIKALNLSHNRLESLCGLERLVALQRIDLRHNEVYDVGEIGRLAALDDVFEIYMAGNPVMDEIEDPRAAVFIQFAQEGHDIGSLKIDGENIGFFEKRKTSDAVPNASKLRSRRLAQRGNVIAKPPQDQAQSIAGPSNVDVKMTAIATGDRSTDDEVDCFSESSLVAKSVRHRGHTRSQRAGGKHSHGGILAQKTTEPPDINHSLDLPRRNRRVVDLEAEHRSIDHEVSESSLVKQAALSGDLDVALGDGPSQAKPTLSGREYTNAAIATVGRSSYTGTAPGGTDDHRHPRSKKIEVQPADAPSLSREVQESHRLRRKIEALKNEVGDDWMRLLTKGDAS